MHKKFHKSTVTKIHVSINDEIKKGDLLLSYLWRNKSYDYHSTKEGIITWLHFAEQQSISKDSKLFTIQLLDPNIPNTEIIFPNGCNTHPHQFYLQLMCLQVDPAYYMHQYQKLLQDQHYRAKNHVLTYHMFL